MLPGLCRVVDAGRMMRAVGMVGNVPMATAMMPGVGRVAAEDDARQDGGQTDSTTAKPVAGLGTHSEHRAPRP